MPTATITWTPQPGVLDQKVYYGKKSVVTGTPLAGTGWIAYLGNPLSAGTNTLTITGLENFFKYQFYVYSEMPGGGLCGTLIEDMSFDCPVIDFEIVDGILSYDITFPAGLVGSDIDHFNMTFWGGLSTAQISVDIAQPLTGTISGTVDVSGSDNWNLTSSYIGGNVEDSGKCPAIPFTTVVAPGKFDVILRNGVSDPGADIIKFYIGAADPVIPETYAGTLAFGNSKSMGLDNANLDVNRYMAVEFDTIISGGLIDMNWLQLRGAATVDGGAFVYDADAAGKQTVNTGTPIQLEAGDIIVITSAEIFIPRSELVKINNTIYDGYIVQGSLSAPSGVAKDLNITWTAFDTHGNTETFTRSVRVNAGQYFSNVLHQASGLPGWPRAVITNFCVTPVDSAIEVPDELICSS